MGLFEKLLSDSITLTEEQFKTFLEKTVAAEHGRSLLAEMTIQNAATGAAEGEGTAEQRNPVPLPSPPIRRMRTTQMGSKIGAQRKGNGLSGN